MVACLDHASALRADEWVRNWEWCRWNLQVILFRHRILLQGRVALEVALLHYQNLNFHSHLCLCRRLCWNHRLVDRQWVVHQWVAP